MMPSQLFFDRMKKIYPSPSEVTEWYSLPHGRGMRINTLKMPVQRMSEMGFAVEPVPFSSLGFRLTDDRQRPGRSPWHHAGAIYIQEPSAMSAVTALDPKPGERILDMCAAPGGKSTQIASLLEHRGILFSNDYVRSRANILVSNFERTGVRNAVVTSLHPDDIACRFSGWFDRVLVDAPCSGEGMFRREEAAVTEWSPEHVRTCAVRQRGILESAGQCVAEGGVMVYSTCTFAPEENELTVAHFLNNHPEFRLEAISANFGQAGLEREQLKAFCRTYAPEDEGIDIPEDITLTRRIFPSNGGEGHFVARLRRTGELLEHSEDSAERSGADCLPQVEEMLGNCFTCMPDGFIHIQNENVYLLPCPFETLRGIPMVRAGLLIGTIEKKRVEPHHALFMAADPSKCKNTIDLSPDSPLLDRFLHGEEIEVPDDLRGYTAVLCAGIITGFGKASNGTLKNRYPKGLRLL